MPTGSCLSYGHSCWGAHGKRSSNDLSNNEQKADRWAVFRAIQDQVSLCPYFYTILMIVDINTYYFLLLLNVNY